MKTIEEKSKSIHVSNMIKTILFDMDGVLIDAKELHFCAFNQALVHWNFKAISQSDHNQLLCGLPTKKKIEILAKNCPEMAQHALDISKKKQYYTEQLASEKISPKKEVIYMLQQLKKEGFKLGLCSNSIRNTVTSFLFLSKIYNYFDLILSNEDVSFPKPDPEIYLRAFKELNVLPEESLILEDSPFGIAAAKASGGHCLEINNIHDVNLSFVKENLELLSSTPKAFCKA